jgi:TatA/E family protein of Tat protein translocase
MDREESQMGGFHLLDLVVVALVVLAIFGPKTLQSLARSAGKGARQVKGVKNNVMAELPVDELAELSQQVPQVPMNSRQALEMLAKPENEASEQRNNDAPGHE